MVEQKNDFLVSNKKIATFMSGKAIRHPVTKELGYHLTRPHRFVHESKMVTEPLPVFVSEDRLEYHLSWDWLMPVVEKVFTEYHFVKTLKLKRIPKFHVGKFLLLTDIEKTYKASLWFITWYISTLKKATKDGKRKNQDSV